MSDLIKDDNSALPETAHIIFGVASTTPAPRDVMQRMFERCQNTSGFENVKDRLHFMAEPVDLGCTVETFPNCQGAGQSWIHDAAAGWGSISPTVTAMWQENELSQSTVLEAVGDTGWLPAVTQVAKDNGGALRLPLAVWGGQACNASEHADDDLQGKVVLIERGTCPFFTKVENAAAKGAKAVLIRSNSGEELHKLSCGPPEPCGDAHLHVPAVMIRQDEGQRLEDLITSGVEVSISLGAKLQGEHFIGLDHGQRLREIGAVSLEERAADAWWLLALEAQYYAYEAGLDRRLATSSAHTVVVPVIDGSRIDGSTQAPFFGGGRGLYADVQLPPPGAMSEFDTLELHLELACPGAWDKSCGAWDYVVQLHLCTAVDETPSSPAVGRVDAAPAGTHGSCTVEMGRWVTAYGRPGRWLTDATAMLPLLRLGGRQHVTLSQPAWSAQRYRPSLSFVLSRPAAAAAVPLQSIFLFPGGGFDGGYNELAEHAPLQFHVPVGVTRAEVHAVVSGHGWGSDSDNCAEFCVTEHRFSVRTGMQLDPDRFYVSRRPGVYTHTLTRAGDDVGCAVQVAQGVTPNQYGTWRFGRAGWCPGGAVRPWVADVTQHVRAGLEGVVTYEGLRGGEAYVPAACVGSECAESGFPASITMQSYVVLYGPPGSSLE